MSLACLWASGDRGQGEPRLNANERTSCHPNFGRDSVVHADLQVHHLIDGLGDPRRSATLPVVVPRDRIQRTLLHISCFPPVHFPPTVVLTRVPGCATAGLLRWNPKYRNLLPEERGHEGCPWVAASF